MEFTQLAINSNRFNMEHIRLACEFLGPTKLDDDTLRDIGKVLAEARDSKYALRYLYLAVISHREGKFDVRDISQHLLDEIQSLL